jgi:hypothetical protein
VERRRCSSFIGWRGKGRRRGEAVAVARRPAKLRAAVRVGEGEEEGVVRGRGAKEQLHGSRVSFYRARRKGRQRPE